MAAGYFCGDWDEAERLYLATDFDAPWSGGVAPVVTRATLVELMADNPDSVLTFDAHDDAMVRTDDVNIVLPVDANGCYHLLALGWTFEGP